MLEAPGLYVGVVNWLRCYRKPPKKAATPRYSRADLRVWEFEADLGSDGIHPREEALTVAWLRPWARLWGCPWETGPAAASQAFVLAGLDGGPLLERTSCPIHW